MVPMTRPIMMPKTTPLVMPLMMPMITRMLVYMDADDDANAAAKCNSYGDACYDAYEAVHVYDAEGCSYDDAYGDGLAGADVDVVVGLRVHPSCG